MKLHCFLSPFRIVATHGDDQDVNYPNTVVLTTTRHPVFATTTPLDATGYPLELAPESEQDPHFLQETGLLWDGEKWSLPDQAIVSALTQNAYEYARQLLSDATKEYAPGEMVKWPALEEEARKYKLDGKIGRHLQAEVDEGERTIEELADTVIAKATALDTYRVKVVAARTSVVKRIANLSADQMPTFSPKDEMDKKLNKKS
jgi:hypothetical protein